MFYFIFCTNLKWLNILGKVSFLLLLLTFKVKEGNFWQLPVPLKSYHHTCIVCMYWVKLLIKALEMYYMQVMIFFSDLMSHCSSIKNKGKATIFVSVTRNSNSTDKLEVDSWAHFTPLSPSVIHFKGTVKFRK